MFYFRVPGPEKVQGEDGKIVEYGWDELHDDLCWPHEQWRSGSADALKAYDEIEAKCPGAKAGTIIAMTDTTFELYLPVITARNKKIGGKNIRALHRLMRPMLEASTTPPEGYVEKGASAKQGAEAGSN